MKGIIETIERERENVRKAAGVAFANAKLDLDSGIAYAALDRIASVVKETEQPGDDGEFERVAIKKRKEYKNEKAFPLLAQALIKEIDEFTEAHSADMRTAEARHREEVRELVDFIRDAYFASDSDDDKRYELIAKHKDGE